MNGAAHREVETGGGSEELVFFKARLVATLLEYQANGVPVSSLRKKWSEVNQLGYCALCINWAYVHCESI